MMGHCQSQYLQLLNKQPKKSQKSSHYQDRSIISMEPLLDHGVMIKPLPASIDNTAIKDYISKLEKDKMITQQKKLTLHSQLDHIRSHGEIQRLLQTASQPSDLKHAVTKHLRNSGMAHFMDYNNTPTPADEINNLNRIRQFMARHVVYLLETLTPWYGEHQVAPFVFQKLYQHGSDEPLSSFKDIFRIGTPPVRVAIFGDDGIGKTTFLHQIAAEWGKAVSTNVEKRFHSPNIVEEGYELLQEDLDDGLDKFDIVIPLDLSLLWDDGTEEKPKELLKKLINSQLLFLSCSDRSFIIDYIFKFPQNTLLLFDNVNSCHSRGVAEILEGSVLGKCTCVVTSRQEEMDSCEEMYCLWKYQLKGITLFQARELAKYFIDQPVSEACRIKVISDMFQDIELYNTEEVMEDLSELAPGLNYYPSVLIASCVLWQERQKIPETWTSFCEKVVVYTLSCHQKRISGLVAQNALFQEYQEELVLLGKIAYDGIVSEKNQEIFKRKYIQENYKLTKRCWDIGLLVGSSRSCLQDKEPYITFKRKCIMDFLAAIYLTTKTDDFSLEEKLEKLLSCCSSLDQILKRKVLFTIICGLSSDTGNNLLNECVKISNRYQSDTNVVSFTNFLLLCVREYKISTNQGPMFELPEILVAEVNSNNLMFVKTLLSKTSRPTPKKKNVKQLILRIAPNIQLTAEMVEQFIHPLASGPLQKLTIECKNKIEHGAYQQIYQEVKNIKKLEYISINVHGNHKDKHYFRSLLKNLSELENLANININIK